MVKSRPRRPRPEPMSAEEAAEIEAKYQEIYRLVERLRVHEEEEEARRGGGDPDASHLCGEPG
ncbi:MAG: hypothetical protein HY859_06205 [Caulobacterales bacterium]|nr:hypothetical protein [Caulobacterales bacterium]